MTEPTSEEVWRNIVVEAMGRCLYGRNRHKPGAMVQDLVAAGFSLADIRTHWTDLLKWLGEE
jgi:hypothetical protein